MFYVLFQVTHSLPYLYKNPTEIYNPLILPPFEIFIKFYFYYEIQRIDFSILQIKLELLKLQWSYYQFWDNFIIIKLKLPVCDMMLYFLIDCLLPLECDINEGKYFCVFCSLLYI